MDPKTLMWTDGPERLTTTTGYEDSMTLSPDGRRLAFSSRTERTQVWSFPFDPQSGRLVGQGELVTSGGADVRMLDVSKDGNRLAYLTLNAGRTKVWAHSFGEEAKLVSVEENASITGPRWSPDGSLLSYLRPTASRGRSTDLVLVDPADGERRIYDMKTLGLTIERPLSIHDWTPDGAGLLVSCRPASGRRGMCSLSLNPEAASGLRVIASDRDRDLFEGRVSPDGKWISFIASPNPASSTVFVTPITGGPWIPITNRSAYDDKPRWAPNGRTVYFLSNRTGFFNVWGQRLDPIAKVPLGKPFQVTDFELSSQMVTPDIMSAQIGVTKNRLILPIKEASGAVWVLEPLKQ